MTQPQTLSIETEASAVAVTKASAILYRGARSILLVGWSLDCAEVGVRNHALFIMPFLARFCKFVFATRFFLPKFSNIHENNIPFKTDASR